MKKYLLLASVAIFAASVNAQDLSKAVYRDADRAAIIDQESNNVPIKQTTVPNEKAASTILLGTSYNVFSTLGDRQNQVVYNPTINTVAFVHRQNDQAAGGSGIISFDYSTDGGATWTVNPFQTTPGLDGGNSNGNRYPNVGIYAPTANTTDAYIVNVGPSLANNAAATNGWAKTFRATAKFDGSNLDETYISNSQVGAANDNNEWGAGGLYVTALGDAFYASTNSNNTGLTSDDFLGSSHDYFINRGVWNGGTNSFDWTTDTIVPGWYTDNLNGPSTNIAGLMNMAWSIDGMTGYMVMIGADSNGTNNTMRRPYVVKTTDGGANWAVMPDFDFSTDPTFQCMIQPLNTNPAIQRPFFSSFDIVVDANNQLRIFAEVLSGFSDVQDSSGFIFGAIQTQGLYEVATNSTGGWDVTFIDSIYVDDHPWDVSTSGLSHFVRPQASRSQDGTKIFYSWIGSDATLSTTREFPQVWSTGHDLTSGMWTPVMNLSNGNNSDFVAAYQTVAVDVIENGGDKQWELPIVYATAIGGSPLSDALTGTQWNFIKGIGFDQSEFTVTPPPTPCAVGVDENPLVGSDIAIYPNPTNGVISISINDVKEFNYSVVDVVGNVVATNHVNGSKTIIDLTTNAKGVYFVTIDTENGSITKKVMLTK